MKVMKLDVDGHTAVVLLFNRNLGADMDKHDTFYRMVGWDRSIPDWLIQSHKMHESERSAMEDILEKLYHSTDL